jgi:hypothetical protein
MTEASLDLADVEHLASTLEALDLGVEDRATLHAIFALAGRAARAVVEDDVSGFTISVRPVIPGDLLGSFRGGTPTQGGTTSPQGDPDRPYVLGSEWNGP